MSRINTNVSSLIAQTALNNSHAQLQTALTRLSTGLKINSGADDPAGLIAAATLGSDIASTNQAITNSQTADQVISTADSGLSQLQTLLTNIQGLVSDAANTGAESTAQIAADQLQVDSSLQAIDQVSSSTSFGSRKLLDGSLNFITSSAAGSLISTGTLGSQTDATAAATVTTSGGAALTFTATSQGTGGNGINVTFDVASGAAATATYDSSTKTLAVTGSAGTTAADVTAAVAANASATAAVSVTTTTTGAAVFNTAGASSSGTTAGGAYNNEISLTSVNGGANYNGLSVVINSGATAGSETAAYNATSNTLTVTANDASTSAQIATAINAQGTFTATAQGAGIGVFADGTNTDVTTGGATYSAPISNLQINQANFGTASSVGVNVDVTQQATQAKLTYSGGALASNTVLQVGGDQGYQVLNLGAGTTLSQIATAVNQISDATGVAASVSGGQLTLNSTGYGSSAFVSAQALSGSFATHTISGNTHTAATRSAGTDIQATINGEQATGDGLIASLSTSTLNLSFSVDSSVASGSNLNFNITGGGANFQLGPNVVSTEQARLGIPSVSTATLGGVDGFLYQLASGGSLSLSNDPNGAAKVVNEALTQITTLRGRLGAFQSTTLQTNINTLSATVDNLTSAQSSIQDADFAAETANLTRAQILVQSGTSVLQIANQLPQQVLALLQHG
jgi:flagellin